MDVEKHRLEYKASIRRKEKRIEKLIYVAGVLFGVVLFPFVTILFLLVFVWYFPHRVGKRLADDYRAKLGIAEAKENTRRYWENQKQELKKAMAGLRNKSGL